MSDKVRQQYELLPYPARDPREEAQAPDRRLAQPSAGAQSLSLCRRARFHAAVPRAGRRRRHRRWRHHAGAASEAMRAARRRSSISICPRPRAPSRRQRAKVRGLDNITLRDGLAARPAQARARASSTTSIAAACCIISPIRRRALPRSPRRWRRMAAWGSWSMARSGRTGVYPMQAMLKTLAAYAPAPALTRRPRSWRPRAIC